MPPHGLQGTAATAQPATCSLSLRSAAHRLEQPPLSVQSACVAPRRPSVPCRPALRRLPTCCRHQRPRSRPRQPSRCQTELSRSSRGLDVSPRAVSAPFPLRGVVTQEIIMVRTFNCTVPLAHYGCNKVNSGCSASVAGLSERCGPSSCLTVYSIVTVFVVGKHIVFRRDASCRRRTAGSRARVHELTGFLHEVPWLSLKALRPLHQHTDTACNTTTPVVPAVHCGIARDRR